MCERVFVCVHAHACICAYYSTGIINPRSVAQCRSVGLLELGRRNWATDMDLHRPARTGGMLSLQVSVSCKHDMTTSWASLALNAPNRSAHRARTPPTGPQSEKGWGPLTYSS